MLEIKKDILYHLNILIRNYNKEIECFNVNIFLNKKEKMDLDIPRSAFIFYAIIYTCSYLQIKLPKEISDFENRIMTNVESLSPPDKLVVYLYLARASILKKDLSRYVTYKDIISSLGEYLLFTHPIITNIAIMTEVEAETIGQSLLHSSTFENLQTQAIFQFVSSENNKYEKFVFVDMLVWLEKSKYSSKFVIVKLKNYFGEINFKKIFMSTSGISKIFEVFCKIDYQEREVCKETIKKRLYENKFDNISLEKYKNLYLHLPNSSYVNLDAHAHYIIGLTSLIKNQVD